jgi:S-adenosyl-L-methionine hydrolase (adenosine-forming)
MSVPRVPPIITLTTDFGLADHYVGTMKGVILSRCAEARIVDISHEIAAFSIVSGAYAIDQAAPYFAAGTVHVIVVDPGVGTERRPVCVEALGQFFVAPDNGVLSLIAMRDGKARTRELANRELWLESVSSTFHGRDIFAPVGAAIASGSARVEDVGPVIGDMELLADLEPREKERGVWVGKILSVDRFGNVITNLKSSAFREIAPARFSIEAGRRRVERFARTFGEAESGVCFAYFGSSGYVELGINQQSAAALLGVGAGDSITMRHEG